MTWSEGQEGETWSAGWQYIYNEDPDLRSCTITIRVWPSSWITNVSFWLNDANGNKISWNWIVPASLPYNQFTTITINTDLLALGSLAATPTADGFAVQTGFDITQVVSFGVSENSYNYDNNQLPPVGGSTGNRAWNAWDRLSILPNNMQAYKETWVKWSQPPVMYEPEEPDLDQEFPLIYGWDHQSCYDDHLRPVAADDWVCNDDRPITDIHWWGSFIGWTQPYLPSANNIPSQFHIGIWTNVPVNDPNNKMGGCYSHPGQLVWENYCDSWVWNFAGYDQDPRWDYGLTGQIDEACFQFNQLLSEDEYFRQKETSEPNEYTGTIYWISIAAIYDDPSVVDYPWGWKTRSHAYNDAAVWFNFVEFPLTGEWFWPPFLGCLWANGVPIIINEDSYDLAFELTTNERPECYDLSADLDHNCVVDLEDFSIFAAQWLIVE